MSCFYPLKAIRYKNRKNPETNKNVVRILRKEEYQKFTSVDKKITYVDGDDIEVLEIPCGQCTGCRMDYARQWANRMMLELESHDVSKCYFVTLTINNDFIDRTGYEEDYPDVDPFGKGRSVRAHVLRPVNDPDTGVVTAWSHSLDIRDLQLFLKRFRQQVGKFRYYAIGEYGSNCRPHYHMILYGVDLPDGDLHFYKKSSLGYGYYNSDLIAKCWPFGYNVVASVTWESCCYTARYMLKKLKGEGTRVYADLNMQAPFSVSSRRPGLAHDYYKVHGLDLETSKFSIATQQGSRSFPPPRYLEKLFEFDDPEISEKRKLRRRLSAINGRKLEMRSTTLSGEEYLKRKEEKFLKACKTIDTFRNLE